MSDDYSHLNQVISDYADACADMERTIEDQKREIERLRAILWNVALALGCDDSPSFRDHIGLGGKTVGNTDAAEKR